MNFDIKDVKSWYNRHDVKVGDEGYFADKIEELKTENNRTRMIVEILDDHAFCFCTPTNRYSFFLPLDAVKEDKPKEKKYRPFKDLYEFYKFLSFGCFVAREDFTQNMLLGMRFTYRDKKALRVASTIVINKIDVDLKDICEPIIEGRNFEHWFDYSEIMNNKGEWQPFGIQEK